MAEQLDPKELVSFKELLMANSIQIDAAVQLLIEKGFFTEAEYFLKLKKVQGQYRRSQTIHLKTHDDVTKIESHMTRRKRSI